MCFPPELAKAVQAPRSERFNSLKEYNKALFPSKVAIGVWVVVSPIFMNVMSVNSTLLPAASTGICKLGPVISTLCPWIEYVG